MKLFKNIDDKLEDIGLIKVRDNEHIVSYERVNTLLGYTHTIDILHKNNGKHIVQSYDRNLFDAKKIGNTCVGMTYQELKLITKKMKQKGWKTEV